MVFRSLQFVKKGSLPDALLLSSLKWLPASQNGHEGLHESTIGKRVSLWQTMSIIR